MEWSGDGEIEYPEHLGLTHCCPGCGRRYGGTGVTGKGPCDDCIPECVA